MKNWMVILMVAGLTACSSEEVQTSKTSQVIESKSLKQQVAEAKVVFDVRSEAEWKQGHLSHAKRIDYTDLSGRIHEFVQDKSTPIYIYCASGGRSGIATEQLKRMGYKNVINAGGYSQLR